MTGLHASSAASARHLLCDCRGTDRAARHRQRVMRQVLADRAFYARSGGGVTLSGGEPVLQCVFAQEI